MKYSCCNKYNNFSDSTTSTVPEEFSENGYDENLVSLSEDEVIEKVVEPASSTSQSSSLSSQGRVPTEEDVKRIKEQLQNNLEEEQMLLGLYKCSSCYNQII
jgi:hypothetical protein